jgi:uncharacterized RDD family membrane protein YckC
MRNAKVIPAPRPDAWARALLAGSIVFAVLSLTLFAFA